MQLGPLFGPLLHLYSSLSNLDSYTNIGFHLRSHSPSAHASFCHRLCQSLPLFIYSPCFMFVFASVLSPHRSRSLHLFAFCTPPLLRSDYVLCLRLVDTNVLSISYLESSSSSATFRTPNMGSYQTLMSSMRSSTPTSSSAASGSKSAVASPATVGRADAELNWG
jgi:hypothetical protein